MYWKFIGPLAIIAALASMAIGADRYRLSISSANPKILSVTADLEPASSLSMAEYGADQFPERWAKFVSDLTAADENGNSLVVEPLGGAKWRVQGAAKRLRIHYFVRLDHEGHTWPGGIDGIAFARDWGVFYSGRTFLVVPDRAERSSVDIDFNLPVGWNVTASWERVSRGRHSFRANGMADLKESLFFAGRHKEFVVSRKGFDLIFALGGPGIAENEADYKRLATQVLDKYIALMGGIPNPPPSRKFSRSVVFINNSKELDGEVIGNHISMILDPSGDRQTQIFSKFIFAHEFFHLWNGKSINVASTGEDWFKEGVTSYYTLKALVEIGAITRQEALDVIADLFYKRYASDPSLGKESMRAVASSTRKDKHWGLIYGGGLFAGICQDVSIRRGSGNKKSLDDLMREFFTLFGGSDKTYTTLDVQQAVARLSGVDHRQFFERHILGAEPVPLEQCLTDAGLDVQSKEGRLAIKERPGLDRADAERLRGILGLQ